MAVILSGVRWDLRVLIYSPQWLQMLNTWLFIGLFTSYFQQFIFSSSLQSLDNDFPVRCIVVGRFFSHPLYFVNCSLCCKENIKSSAIPDFNSWFLGYWIPLLKALFYPSFSSSVSVSYMPILSLFCSQWKISELLLLLDMWFLALHDYFLKRLTYFFYNGYFWDFCQRFWLAIAVWIHL